MYRDYKINIENAQIGNYAYNDYTEQWYIISVLPNFIEEGSHVYALIRLDGQGYYYKSESLDELKNKISQDNGETNVFSK